MDKLHRSQLVVRYRPCAWCAAEIAVVRRPGRPRLYCGHTCRQRAYEHRHGFVHARTVLPLPGQQEPGERWEGSGYELGVVAATNGAQHALRTSVRPEGPRRQTVCGLLARPVPGRHFNGLRGHACRTCSSLVERHPLQIGVSPSNELSRLRSVITEGLEHRLEAAALVDYLERATHRGR